MDRVAGRLQPTETYGTLPAMAEAPRPTVLFVMEQHLGHRTYAENLRRAIEPLEEVDARWSPVAYEPTDRWWERVPSEAVRGALRGRAEVAAALTTVRADVRVFNTQVPAVIGPRAARAVPYVLCTDVTPRQYDAMAAGYRHKADRPGPLRWAKDWWNRRVFRAAAAHAPWSNWVAESLVADYGVDPAAIEVIPPGVDIAAWTPGPRGDGPVKFLFVGADFERKGGPLLLEAFATVGGAAELHVVTRSEVASRPGVHVHHGLSPNDSELLRLYRTSDVFVLPSGTETFGIAAIEAAAAGLPVLATTTGGLQDLVVEGRTGFLVEPGDTVDLARTMVRLAGDPDLRHRLGTEGRKQATARFDVARNAERLVALARRCALAPRTERRAAT
jgi:glycosyltransferase involved in cell wall biosynthesis